MWKIRKSSSHTVGPGSRRSAGNVLYLLVFAATAAGVYWLGLAAAERSTANKNYPATAAIYEQTDSLPAGKTGKPSSSILPDLEEVKRQITSEASLHRAIRRSGVPPEPTADKGPRPTAGRVVAQVRQNLRVRAAETSTAGELGVAVTYADRVPEYAARLVNALAQDYAEHCRTQWRQRTQHAYLEAREGSERAYREWIAAKTRLDAFLELHAVERTPADENPGQTKQEPQPPGPPLIDNPEWIELHNQLAELQRQREELLVDRTLAHPEVQENGIQIAALQQQMAATPRRVRGSPAEEPDPTTPPDRRPGVQRPLEPERRSGPTGREGADAETAQQLAVLEEAVGRTARQHEQASEIERRAWRQYQHLPQIEVQLASSVGRLTPQAPRMALVWLALAAGLAAVAGLGMISTAVAMEPTLATLAQAQRVLPVPIVGTIPETDPASRPGATRRWQRLVRLGMILGGLGLIAGFATAVIRALGG